MLSSSSSLPFFALIGSLFVSALHAVWFPPPRHSTLGVYDLQSMLSHLAVDTVIALPLCPPPSPPQQPRTNYPPGFFPSIFLTPMYFFMTPSLWRTMITLLEQALRLCWQGQAGVTQRTLAVLLIVFYVSPQTVWMWLFSGGCEEGLESKAKEAVCVFTKDWLR